MRVWRICQRQHVGFDGEGARLAGGRWGYPGIPIVYTSATLSLAALELLFHLGHCEIPRGMVAVPADIPDTVARTALAVDEVPEHVWRRYPGNEVPGKTVRDWIAGKDTAVMHVPSAIVPTERNYLLNPAHPAFREIQVGAPRPFSLRVVLPR